MEVDARIENEDDLINFKDIHSMKNIKYLSQFIIIIVLFVIYKILGLKYSTYLSGKIF